MRFLPPQLLIYQKYLYLQLELGLIHSKDAPHQAPLKLVSFAVPCKKRPYNEQVKDLYLPFEQVSLQTTLYPCWLHTK